VRDQLEALVLQMYRSNILYSEGVREFKKRFILTVLQENKGNQCRAARELGMHRNTLSRTISELKIDVRQLRDGVKRPPRSARPVTLEKKIVQTDRCSAEGVRFDDIRAGFEIIGMNFLNHVRLR